MDQENNSLEILISQLEKEVLNLKQLNLKKQLLIKELEEKVALLENNAE